MTDIPRTQRTPNALDASALARVAAVFGQQLTPEQEQQVGRFFDLLLTWNVRINLTGARTPAELLDEHLPDSFALSRLVPLGSRLVDIGSGGGLPVLPFAAFRPDVSFTLVEPRAKRVAFLRTAVRELGLLGARQIDIRQGRLEDLAADSSFDAACSRATFAPEEWMARAGQAKLLRPGGRIVVFGTAKPTQGDPAVLLDEVSYTIKQGNPRWAGAYCST
jgi:16S rRNA (guanine527-N7)-methyltransferase